MTADPEVSALLRAVWEGEIESAGGALADLVVERSVDGDTLLGYVPYNDTPSEGVMLAIRRHGAVYYFMFTEADLGLQCDVKFGESGLAARFPAWLDQQFELLNDILSK
jgi:hypothetical protein